MNYILDKGVKIKLNDFMLFINKYLDYNFNGSFEIKEVIFHFKGPSRIREFIEILQFENLGVLQLKDLKLEENNYIDKNGDFKKYIEKFRLYDEPFLNFLTSNDTKYDGKVIGVKEIQEIKSRGLIKLDTYSSNAIYKEWKEFSFKIPQFTVFTGTMKLISYPFFKTLFGLIYKEKKDFKSIEVKKLYENILSETRGKTNFENEIIIFYNLNDYINNYSSIYPILYELQEKSKLVIEKIEIKKGYLYFTLRNLVNISIDDFEKSFDKIKRKLNDYAIFKDDELIINDDLLDFKNKESSETYKTIKVFFEILNKIKKIFVTFNEIESIREKDYKGLELNEINWDNSRNTIRGVNKRVKDKHQIKKFIGITKKGLKCEYLKIQK